MEPAAAWPIRRSAGISKPTCSWPSTACRWPTMESAGICFRLNCRQRDSTVTGIFCGSVVARMNDVRRRLFQRLEHGVERMPGQHVDFVDHVDLEAARARRVDGLLEQLGHFLDATVRGRVQFEVVDETAGIDLGAGATDAAGLGGDAGFAVERLGQDARQRGLAHASGAGEQPGVVQSLGVQRVRERAHHVILSHEGIERSRPPLAGQYQISHGWIVEPLQEPLPTPRNAKGRNHLPGIPVENNPVPFAKTGWRA